MPPSSHPSSDRQPPSDAEHAPITEYLRAMGDCQPGAADSLLALVYDHLRAVAAAHMAHERRDHTFQPTALVHEALLKVLGGAPVAWQSREHFFNTMGRAMRLVLIDHARALMAGAADGGARGATFERGGARRPHPLPESITDPSFHHDPDQIRSLDEALASLEAIDPRAARVVVWRFYNGLELTQIAAALDTSLATVKRDWLFARTWLLDHLTSSRGVL